MTYLTKENPGCYHSALKYLSEITGISQREKIIIKDFDLLFVRRGKKPKLKYRSYDIEVVSSEGERHPYIHNSARFDQRGITPREFVVTVNRKIEDFHVKIHPAGKYKDCLGGGWYEMVEMIRINDKYFAYMDCSCS